MTIRQAFENFMANDFESACDSSTKASWGGGSYSVELAPDGCYRLLDTNSIGNLYRSSGLILRVPALSNDEWDSDETQCYYDDAIDCMNDMFYEAMSGLQEG